MQTTPTQKIKLFCALYFALLGLFSFMATAYGASVSTIDWMLLGFSLFPLSTNKRWLLTGFGFLGMLCAAYIAIACLIFHTNPNTQTPDFTYLMGYLLALATLVASFGLVYAAVQTSNQKTFSFI